MASSRPIRYSMFLARWHLARSRTWVLRVRRRLLVVHLLQLLQYLLRRLRLLRLVLRLWRRLLRHGWRLHRRILRIAAIGLFFTDFFLFAFSLLGLPSLGLRFCRRSWFIFDCENHTLHNRCTVWHAQGNKVIL